MKNWIWIATLVALVLGCSGKSEKPTYATPVTYGGSDAQATGGKKSTGGSKSGTSVGGGGAAGGLNVGGISGQNTQAATGPNVQITNPESVATPDSGPVLADTSVKVLCTVTAGSSAVDTSSVKISYVDSKGATPTVPANVNSTANPNEWSATFALASVPSGAITFTCTASDRSSPPQTGSNTVGTFVDHGPSVVINTPADRAAVSGKSSLPINFNVTPVSLTSTGTDDGKDVDVASVSLAVNGVNIPAKQDATDPTLFTADANLSDPSLFQPPLPDSMSVEVVATNKRSQPGPTKGRDAHLISLDAQGPIISNTSLVDGRVIGGTTQIDFTVSDAGSGVRNDSITFECGGLSSTYSAFDSMWTKAGTAASLTFTYTFDAKLLNTPGSTTQATLYIRVSDNVGNQTTKSILLYRDDQPPFVSIDPPLVRVTRYSGTSTSCSAPFDPVGSAATSTFDDTYPSAYVFVRALVLERTNKDSGQQGLFYATLDTNSVRLYASDSGEPVLVGNAAGGPCADINQSVKSSGAQIQLSGVATDFISTRPDYSGTGPALALTPAIANASLCTQGPPGTPRLCGGTSDMTYVMPQYYNHDMTAIFAPTPVNSPNDTLCAGSKWNLGGTLLKEGWVCLAAQASDQVGNSAVSAPMPVCFNYSGNANCTTANRPTCTDGCTPPSRSYDGDDASGNPIPFVYPYTTY